MPSGPSRRQLGPLPQPPPAPPSRRASGAAASSRSPARSSAGPSRPRRARGRPRGSSRRAGRTGPGAARRSVRYRPSRAWSDSRLDGSRATQAPFESPWMSVSTSNKSSQRSSTPGARDASPVATKSIPDELAREIAVEQAHVDRVHQELEKAGLRADSVQAEGLARTQFGRQVEIGDAEGAGLFERDALMFHAAKRRTALDTQYEGLVFGRLDIDHAMLRAAEASGNGHRTSSDAASDDREVRYIGRLGVRDDDYEPLVIDWRAPAASAFYRATPTQ